MSIYYGYDTHQTSSGLADEHVHYKNVFSIDMSKSVNTGQSHKGSRVGRVQDSEYSLFQNEYRRGPVPGLDYIQNTRKCFMLFKCPEMVNINISIFITVRVIISTPKHGKWGYIIGNDDGVYDKFIGYKSNTTNQLSYGGGLPAKEYNCTIQSDVDIFDKHLISCHWLLSGSCLYINGVKSPDSDFTANPKMIGETYGSIFTNERLTSATNQVSRPFTGNIYDIKIISGFLDADDVQKISNEIMRNQKIS